MGYRNYIQGQDIYAKPIGYMILVYNGEQRKLYNFFRGTNEKEFVWHTKKHEEELTLIWLMQMESETKTNFMSSTKGFSFQTIEDIVNSIL